MAPQQAILHLGQKLIRTALVQARFLMKMNDSIACGWIESWRLSLNHLPSCVQAKLRKRREASGVCSLYRSPPERVGEVYGLLSGYGEAPQCGVRLLLPGVRACFCAL
mmetsp:Transcript_34968/g.76933  ORF Transcript_34968/g.76933 Transcript_34968/m.76933 type:complete len:108 (-) Transcript_34968:178-501(-)